MTASVKTNHMTVSCNVNLMIMIMIINLLCHAYDIFMTGCVLLVMSSCHDKDTGYDVLVYVNVSLPSISNNDIFALKMS